MYLKLQNRILSTLKQAHPTISVQKSGRDRPIIINVTSGHWAVSSMKCQPVILHLLEIALNSYKRMYLEAIIRRFHQFIQMIYLNLLPIVLFLILKIDSECLNYWSVPKLKVEYILIKIWKRLKFSKLLNCPLEICRVSKIFYLRLNMMSLQNKNLLYNNLLRKKKRNRLLINSLNLNLPLLNNNSQLAKLIIVIKLIDLLVLIRNKNHNNNNKVITINLNKITKHQNGRLVLILIEKDHRAKKN